MKNFFCVRYASPRRRSTCSRDFARQPSIGAILSIFFETLADLCELSEYKYIRVHPLVKILFQRFRAKSQMKRITRSLSTTSSRTASLSERRDSTQEESTRARARACRMRVSSTFSKLVLRFFATPERANACPTQRERGTPRQMFSIRPVRRSATPRLYIS